ncbi:Acetylxylan esterase 2 [Staphylotrichum tortipilum]|uniref:Acetylxylan esterase 2 n=1 Tax=Staphylotrichum tortipilum TaxID=2831512 RepID=A0AAN6MKN7_9PEZI|nr:Acetylxylan esterase 2 [Staphylotrichum longicolle]
MKTPRHLTPFVLPLLLTPTTAFPSPQDAITTPPTAAPNTTSACPQIQIFAARETTAPPEFGSSRTLVDLILTAFPAPNQAAVEAIAYPAAGATPEEYAASVTAGIAAVVSQTAAFAARCPGSVIVMHGYSQGSQIMDDAFCGGPDGSSLDGEGRLVGEDVAGMTAALVWMGNPRHSGELGFEVGSAVAGGFAARPPGFSCPEFEDRIQSYCDAADPFCSDGDDPAVHQGYGQQFGQEALDFVVSKIAV